ncbi:hypothetical protein EN809_032920 [Mesorhizobium sp. M2E.F.Ca.ET.166.01.1.1]|nr:hypothetical protein EN862_032105 [Mesorhizobium sp. M2E.F.Ca.ET.219.01.1.1]TGT65631.1 hypothetical protein EN809_032920 [Mesorhizobium sp. M2E.F.Ca.ET.166.01.1.1]TGV97676.1 hypothetical protein EN797_032930 [Mesorhizobium sp. M2E.F.Ca.ET.154.01.1.1]
MGLLSLSLVVIHVGAGERCVECIATPGGRRGAGTEKSHFLFPAGEYATGRFGSVIDPDRHASPIAEADGAGSRRSPDSRSARR